MKEAADQGAEKQRRDQGEDLPSKVRSNLWAPPATDSRTIREPGLQYLHDPLKQSHLKVLFLEVDVVIHNLNESAKRTLNSRGSCEEKARRPTLPDFSSYSKSVMT